MPETIERPSGLDIPELRSLTAAFLDPPEVRADEDGDGWTFVGHAAVWGRLSVDLGGFRERIQRGAFTAVLDDPALDVTLVADHGMGALTTVASTRGGTLELSEDAKGLRVYARVAPTTVGGDLKILIQRGDIKGMSFGFSVDDEVWSKEGGEAIRTVRKVRRLYDVSIVSFPAYPQTDVSMRSALPLLVERRDALNLFDPVTGRVDADEVRRVQERASARTLELTPEQREILEHAASIAAGGETPEQRETCNDLCRGLQAALDELFVTDGDYYYVWVVDFTDEAVIFQVGGRLYSAPYTVVEGGPIEIGVHVQVRPVTEYVSTDPSERAEGEPADETASTEARDRLERRLRLMRMEL